MPKSQNSSFMNAVMNWTSIGDHLSWKAMEFPDMSKVQVGRSSSCDSSDCFNEVGPLTDRVNHYHDCVVTAGVREFCDEIYTDSISMFLRNREGLQFSNWEVMLYLGTKA